MTEADLPAIVPIFPLGGVLLLPRTELPLHIFEPRYRAMTAAALDGDKMIAMIQPSDLGDSTDMPVYPVGCLGRIVSARLTDDGRYYITLTGVARFRVREELPLREGYRRVVPDYERFVGDLIEVQGQKIERERLVGALKGYAGIKGLSADWSALDGLSAERLVNVIAMICPFTPAEKQALLEAANVTARGELLVSLLEMALLSAKTPSATRH